MDNARQDLKVSNERAILVAAKIHGKYEGDDLAELTALAESAGAVVVDRFQQKLRRANTVYYIGKGKAEMLAERVKRFDADVVIFDNDLSPGQVRELEKIVEIKVIDRSELILDIFASRAKTKQASLQVELAQLEYTAPRLTRMWSHLDTVTAGAASGGVGTRGTGEKQLEIDKRLVGKRITELKRQLAVIDKQRLREIQSRKGLFKICLVGYTNAGKSSILNRLTDSDVFVEDRLFATLDTRTRRWGLAGGIDVLLSDTVGFVRMLPHHLVASFKATLEEAVNADLLLNVLDVSDADAEKQIKSVNLVLKDIGCKDKDMLMVFNKVDAVRDVSQLEILQTMYPDAVSISAKSGFAIEELIGAVLEKYKGKAVTVQVTSSQKNGKVQSYLRANGRVLDEEYEDGFVIIKVVLGKNQLGELKGLRPDKIIIEE